VDDILESCWRNKVVLKGIIASPLHSEEGILQTLNMKIRYKSNFTVDFTFVCRDIGAATPGEPGELVCRDKKISK